MKTRLLEDPSICRHSLRWDQDPICTLQCLVGSELLNLLPFVWELQGSPLSVGLLEIWERQRIKDAGEAIA